MNEILNLKNVSKKYHSLKKETLAVENITFSIYSNEFLSIVGPSGCGKSTILSLISGLLKPSSGKISFKGEKNLTIGYMFQRDYLFDWRTIEKNLFLGLEIKNILNESSKKYALNLLEKYDLGKFKNHFPSELSGGMRQKVSLIRTLAIKPQILLLDEPFSALDYQTRLILSGQVKNIIKSEKLSAILVTHDISEAVMLSDRVAILSKRPSKIKTFINFDSEFKKLNESQRRNNKKFSEYFDVIWSELK